MNRTNIQSISKSNFISRIDESQFLGDHSQRDAVMDQHKFVNTIQEFIYNKHNDKKSYRLAYCGNWLKFKLYSDQNSDFHHKLHQANFCRVRNCPICQYRKTLLMRGRFFKMIPELPDDLEYLFLTLTVKNCETTQLKQTLQNMSKAWNRFLALKSLKFDSWLVGWFRSVEVTRQHGSASAQFDLITETTGSDIDKSHPHYHVLLAVKKSYFHKFYISQAKWVELWRNAMQLDYDPIVDIRRVKTLENKHDVKNQTELDDVDLSKIKKLGLRKAVLETCKYSVKPSDFFPKATEYKAKHKDASLEHVEFDKLVSPQDEKYFLEFNKQVHKMRMNASGGLFKDLLAEIDLAYENGDDDELIYVGGKEVDASEVTHVADLRYTINRKVCRYAIETYSFVDGTVPENVHDDPLANSSFCFRKHVDRLETDTTLGAGSVKDYNHFYLDFELKLLVYNLFNIDILTLGYVANSDAIFKRFDDYKIYSKSYKFVASNGIQSAGGAYNLDNLTPHFFIKFNRDIPY